VGNGVTNWTYDTTPAYLSMGYWHSLYDTALYNQINEAQCDFSGPYGTHITEQCNAWLDEFNSFTQYVNVYDIFGTCWGRGSAPQKFEGVTPHAKRPKKTQVSSADYTPWVKKSYQTNELPPCTWGNPLIEYLNSDEVRTNLHIPSSIQAWDLCTEDIFYVIEPQGSQWIYEELAAKGKYKMLHYSGDTDGAVATIGTENWIETLDWNVTSNWAPYNYFNETLQANATGGYYEVYVPKD